MLQVEEDELVQLEDESDKHFQMRLEAKTRADALERQEGEALDKFNNRKAAEMLVPNDEETPAEFERRKEWVLLGMGDEDSEVWTDSEGDDEDDPNVQYRDVDRSCCIFHQNIRSGACVSGLWII